MVLRGKACIDESALRCYFVESKAGQSSNSPQSARHYLGFVCSDSYRYSERSSSDQPLLRLNLTQVMHVMTCRNVLPTQDAVVCTTHSPHPSLSYVNKQANLFCKISETLLYSRLRLVGAQTEV